MTMTSHILSGGFSKPVFESQNVFRMLMDGMSRPGTIHQIETESGQPQPFGPAAAAIALTLCDHETSFWLSAAFAKTPVAEWIAFHSGAHLTREKADARFAFVEHGAPLTSFGLFALGSQEYPDRSTTIVIEVTSLESGTALTLSGPGLLNPKSVAIDGLPQDFVRLWTDNRALFPRGIDVVLTAGKRLMCLPRTVKISA